MEQMQMRDLENLCIQECAPTCTATCPLHVDVKALNSAVAQGDFSSGLQILKKTIPFPGIVSRVCEQPCRKVCLRDQAIAMADLERACVEFGGTPEEKSGSPVNRRKQSVAIVGGGINGLTAAFDLMKKRYTVVIFEAASVLGGRLRSMPESRLPKAILEQELDSLLKMGIEVRLNTPVSGTVGGGAVTLGELNHQFDAVYLATGSGSNGNYSIDPVKSNLGRPDPLTRETQQPGIFAAMDAGETNLNFPLITAMADGRSAALSMDRYIQKVSLTASRSNEGSYESCLYTNVEGVAISPVTRMAGNGYSRDEAVKEAGRCLKCECMECVKKCEYLAAFGGYPKKYARQIYNNLSIVMGTRQANKLINSCSLCGQCAEICPTDLDMGRLCKEARQTMVTQNHMPPSAHDFALRDMQFSNSEKFALTKNQPGTDASEYVFFPGCQLSASAPEQVEKVYTYLQNHLPSVGLMLRCCGAPADWAGEQTKFKAVLEEFKTQYASLGNPTVILACSSCYQIFKTNLPEIPILSLWEVFDQHGLPEGTNTKKSGVVSIHDPCSTRHESQIHESVRRLIQRTGTRIEELPLNREKTSCCSYGGDMWLANREVSQKVIERRIAESQNDYLTYCSMCRDFFASKGKPTLHLLDLLFETDPQMRATRRGPGYSQRHENRAHLKQTMLKEYWGEIMPEQKRYEAIHLMMSADVEKLLEDRLILVEDLQQVIEYAERTGYKIVQSSTGHIVAHYKPTRVTYWVEYCRKDGGYEIINAYSHRMEIKEDLKS